MSKIALVTGGTRGIGAAIAKSLSNRGYKVIANYHNNHKAAREFSTLNNIPIYSWDVGNAEECQENIAKIKKDYGQIGVLIHNAGITADSFLHKMTAEKWHSVIQTNLNSCFYMTQPVVEEMRQNGFGRIVLISSVNGLKGQIGQTNYCAAKAGLVGFAKSLALENANKGITVNVVAPGYIATEMVAAINQDILEKIKMQIPKGRLGSAEEVAHAVKFLIHENAQYITGETININGGLYMQ